MNRAIVIKTYGDPETCNAIVDGITRTITIDHDEMAALRKELERLRAENEIRAYGDSKRFERATEELAKKYQPQQENPVKWAILAVWTMLWLACYIAREVLRYSMAKTKEQRSRENKERYNWYKERGICTTCGRAWVEPGHVLCKACTAKNYSYRDNDREQRNALKAARRQERIAKGICTECGKRPATEGMRMCPRCRAMRNDSTRKYKIQQRTKRRYENGNRNHTA